MIFKVAPYLGRTNCAAFTTSHPFEFNFSGFTKK